MLIDSHAHLTHESFEQDIDSLVEKALSAGVDAIINICTNPQEVERGLCLSKKYPWIHTVAATTPHDVLQEGEKYFLQMQHYAREGKIIAIGETGLDYHHFPHTKDLQQEFLRRYLLLAKECHLPVVIHCREAFSDLFRILDKESIQQSCILHCFTGSEREAQEVISRGWYVSLSGIVTFKRSRDLQEIAKSIPLNQLLIETDAPYLAPVPHRGKRCEPAFLLDTADFIANLRNMALHDFCSATSHNTRMAFALKAKDIEIHQENAKTQK